MAPAGSDDVGFERFAADWIDQIQQRGQARSIVRPVASGARTVRRVDSGYRTELRVTGHPAAPYVGILRYTEVVLRCPAGSDEGCGVSRRTPITEIFRYEDGRWIY